MLDYLETLEKVGKMVCGIGSNCYHDLIGRGLQAILMNAGLEWIWVSKGFLNFGKNDN